MAEKTGRIARNAVWVSLDNIAALVLGMVGSVLVARAMGPTILGYYNYVIFVTSLAMAVIDTGIPGTAVKFGSELLHGGHQGQARTVLRLAFRLQIALGVLLTLIGVGLVYIVVPVEHRDYSVLAALTLLPGLMLGGQTSYFSASQNFGWPALSSFCANVIGFSIIMATLYFHWGLVGLVSTILVSRIFDVGFRGLLMAKIHSELREPGHDPLPAELRQRIWRFGSLSMVMFVINILVWSRSETFFLKYFCAIEQVALYTLSFSMLEKVWILPNLFAYTVGVHAMGDYGRDRATLQANMRSMFRYLSLAALPMLVGLAAVAPSFVRGFYGPRYEGAIAPMVIQALLTIPRLFAYPTLYLLNISERQDILVKWGVSCAALSVVLDLFFIPGYAAIGAAWANGLTQVIASAALMYISLLLFPLRLPLKVLTRIALSAALMGIVAWAISAILPPLPGLAAGIASGGAVYILLLRTFRALEPEDRNRLLSLQTQLPGRVRSFYGRFVYWVIPETSPATTAPGI